MILERHTRSMNYPSLNVIVYGNIAIETKIFLSVSQEDQEMLADEIFDVVGGSGWFCGLSAAQFGCKVSLVSRFGNDGSGLKIRNHIDNTGINLIEYSKSAKHNSNLRFVSLIKNAIPVRLYIATKNPRQGINDEYRSFPGNDIVIVGYSSSNTFKLVAMDSKYKNSLKVANLSQSIFKISEETLRRYLPSYNIVSMNSYELRMIAQNQNSRVNEFLEFCNKNNVLLIVTDATEGISLYQKGKHRRYEMSFEQKVDTTGAGDFFITAFSILYFNKTSLSECVEISVKLSENLCLESRKYSI